MRTNCAIITQRRLKTEVSSVTSHLFIAHEGTDPDLSFTLIIKHNLEVNTLRNGYLVVNFFGKAVGFKSGSLATFHGSHSLSKKEINSRLNEEEELKQQGH